EQKNFELSVSPTISTRVGTINEYVFEKNSNGELKKLSELNWDIKPLIFFGLDFSFSWKFLSLDIYGKIANPMSTGKMEDSDWLDLNDVKNIYSIHEVNVSSAFDIGANFSYMHKSAENFFVGFSFAADFSHIALHARNGYGWYGDSYYGGKGVNVPWEDGKFFSRLQGIDYKRKSIFLWLGGNMKLYPHKKFSANLSFAVSPYTYIFSIDNHYGRSPGYFADVIHSSFSVCKVQLCSDFAVTENFLLALNIDWFVSNIMKGKTYAAYTNAGPWYTLDASGGASVNYFSASLCGKFRFKF
ncbi:MAG: omptin family outer membrane protease, partial [Treponema sp.]|nr:omptin family outer membrane protease [Treponema sp.]